MMKSGANIVYGRIQYKILNCVLTVISLKFMLYTNTGLGLLLVESNLKMQLSIFYYLLLIFIFYFLTIQITSDLVKE